MSETAAQFLTLGAISRKLQVPPWRVKYVIDTRGIQPAQRAGMIRLFSRDTLPKIKAALEKIAERKFL